MNHHYDIVNCYVLISLIPEFGILVTFSNYFLTFVVLGIFVDNKLKKSNLAF